jgi:hypothetical protein
MGSLIQKFHDPVLDKPINPLHPKQEEFLERISRWEETEAEACSVVGIHRVVLEQWKQDPKFLTRLKIAHADMADKLEKEAIRRAVKGVEEEVYYQGDVVGTKVNYSDSVLLSLLKGMKPEVYGDRREINANIKMFSIVDVLTTMKRHNQDASRTIHQESQVSEVETPVGARLQSPESSGDKPSGGDNVGKRSRSKSGGKEGQEVKIPVFTKKK